MNKIVIYKDKIFFRKGKKDTDITDTFLKVIMLPCIIEDNVTVKDLIYLIHKEKDILSKRLFPEHFTEYYNYLYEKAQEADSIEDDKFSHLELFKYYDISENGVYNHWDIFAMSHNIS